MTLTSKSISRLKEVHLDLQRVIYKAAEIFDKDFIVTEGIRTLKRQAELLTAGASRTMKSRHLTGHAVDLAAVVDGEVRWDWPLYTQLGVLVKEAARIEGVQITWGGDWARFRDGPHFELPWKQYPIEA